MKRPFRMMPSITHRSHSALSTWLLAIVMTVCRSYVMGQSNEGPIDINFIDFFSQRNGLSSNLVTDIVQDKQGYLWIGTEDGLNRYDGYTFKVYKSDLSDSTSIQFNKINHLAVDRSGNIWAGSTDGLISYFHPPTQKFINLDWEKAGLPGEVIGKIFFDRYDHLWVAVNKHGLYKFDAAKNRFDHVSDLPHIHPIFRSGEHYTPAYNTIYDIHEDESGMLWLATHDGLYLYNPRSGQFTALREKAIDPFAWRNDCFVRILPAKDGFWLSAYGGGLTHFNIRTKEWKNFKPNQRSSESPTANIIYDIGWRNDNELWICSVDKGWGIFNISDKTFVFPEILYLTNSNVSISDIVIQPSGVIWFSSRLKGLFKYAPRKNLPAYHRTEVKHSEMGDDFRTAGFYHDIARHKLYYGTALADGLHIRDLNTNREKILSFPTQGYDSFMEVTSVLQDSLGTLWILTRDLVFTLDKEKEELVLYQFQPTSSKSPMYRDIIRSRTGDIWLATQRMGIFRIDPETGAIDNFRQQPGTSNSIVSNFVRKLLEDKNGNIWAATNNGLSIYNPVKETFHNYKRNTRASNALGSSNLMDIDRMPDGSIWIATADRGLFHTGILAVDSLTFTHLGTQSGLPSEVTHAIGVDPDGTLWAATPSAIAAIESNGEIRSYFPPTFAREISIDREGTLFMGTSGGFMTFNPKALSTETIPAPKLVINTFKYMDTEVPLWFDSTNSASIHLKYDQNFISFDFAVLDFTDPLKNTYTYFLENADNSWIKAGNRHYVSYTNLSPGTYRFRVKAANAMGVWTDPGLTVNITITPPFWSTWYFRFITITVLSIAVYTFYTSRIEKIRKAENLKSEYNKKISEIEMSALRAQMNPHFIFNSLNSINRYIVKADSETASLYLTKFSRLIRLILDNSKSPRVMLENELTAIRLYIEMEQIRFDHRFSYTIECGPLVNPQRIEIPPMILQPYIENAIWHGLMGRENHGKLYITIDVKAGMLECVIEDNGVGREKSMKAKSATGRKKSYGMQITSNRLDLLRLESKMESSVEIIDLKDEHGVGTGTRVIVKMPAAIHRAHDIIELKS